MNEIEYFIFVPVKAMVSRLAKLARYMMMAVMITAIAEIVLVLLLGSLLGVHAGHLSDVLLNIVVVLISIECYWCHNVLLANRGMSVTRFAGVFALIMAGILTACTFYTAFTHELLLIKQGQAPVIITFILFVSSLVNLPFMAAAPLKQRIAIPVFLFLLMACIITMPIPLIGFILKIALFCVGAPLLRRLEQVAPLIISMPPRQ